MHFMTPCHPKDLGATIRLFHHRWNVRVLAQLHASRGGARFVVLTHALGVSRDALRASLAALQDAGFVERNPGYGHPLRPEYVLTKTGRRVAPACARFHGVAKRLGALQIAYRKWTAPVLVSLRGGHSQFNAIQASLDGISPRALAQGLRTCCESELVLRDIDNGYPPRPLYRLSRSGSRIASATAAIAGEL